MRLGNMRRRSIELGVGLALLLGPLGYALTLEPEVVEVVETVPMTVEAPAPTPIVVPDVIPSVAPPKEIAPPTQSTPPTQSAPVPDDRLAFAFVTEAGLVLSTEAPTSWGRGRLRAHPGPGEYRAAKRADPEAIPEALWAQRGRSFDLYGVEGKVCTARLGALTVLAQHDGPSLYDLFHGEDGDVDYEYFEAQEHSPAKIRREVWSQTAGYEFPGAWLVAEVVSPTSCEGAVWARDSELPAPALLRVSDEPSPLTERRIAEHEASEALEQTRVDYTAWYEQELPPEARELYETWAELRAKYPATVRTWHDAEGTATFVELEFGAPGESCGEGFDSTIHAVDRVVEGRFEPTESTTGAIAIFDADLDGRYELLYADEETDRVQTLSSETLAARWDIDAVFVCPC